MSILSQSRQKSTITESSLSGKPPFVRLLNRHANRISRLVSLEVEGEAVFPDAFEWSDHRPPRTQRARKSVKYEFTESYARNEPRIDLIKKSLERFTSFGTFHSDGTVLPVDGFRLHELKNWANYSATNLQLNVGSISSYCNCDCEFCYEKSTRGADLPWRRMMLSMQESATRVRYYSTEKRRGLVTATNFTLEPFTNPRCMDIIELIHDADPKSWITLFTNGALLTEEVVSRLAEAQPLIIVMSLNASTPEMWLRSMGGKSLDSAEAAFRAMKLLRDYEVPTVGSYVPWPSKPISDLMDAVRYMDEMDVVRARVPIPTFTRFHPIEPPFDPDTYWPELLDAVRLIRQEVRVPVGVMPAHYEVKTMSPLVYGVIKNSPAEEAGIRFGDIITAIDGQEVFTIPETRGVLGRRAMKNDTITSTTFTVYRDDNLLNVTIPHPSDGNKLGYPYRAFARWGHTRHSNSLGIHFSDGFRLTYIAKLAEICQEFRGKKILLFASQLMEPHFRQALEMVAGMDEVLDSVELYVGKPLPAFFGGSVVIGDLWVVSDLISYTKEWMNSTEMVPDVVVVPSSFLSIGKRDLLGYSYVEFERELDIELRLIPCTPIAD
ncbi:radical SAM protein [Candidatus Poribacteria bacterium]